MLDDRFIELIDEVAKSMTAAPPDASLAQRVSKRIAEEGERRTTWTRPWVLVPVASACVVMLAMFVARENSGSVRLKPDTTPVTNAAPATPSVVERPFQGRGDRGPENLERGPERAALQRNAVVQQAELQQITVPPIEVDRLDVQPLVEMDEIQISPIAIDRIEIAAMP
jgi:hypothetical protein